MSNWRLFFSECVRHTIHKYNYYWNMQTDDLMLIYWGVGAETSLQRNLQGGPTVRTIDASSSPPRVSIAIVFRYEACTASLISVHCGHDMEKKLSVESWIFQLSSGGLKHFHSTLRDSSGTVLTGIPLNTKRYSRYFVKKNSSDNRYQPSMAVSTPFV